MSCLTGLWTGRCLLIEAVLVSSPRLAGAVGVGPDAAPETPGRTSRDFLEPATSGQGQGLQVQAMLGPPGAPPQRSRRAGEDQASEQGAVERTWVSEELEGVAPPGQRLEH